MVTQIAWLRVYMSDWSPAKCRTSLKILITLITLTLMSSLKILDSHCPQNHSLLVFSFLNVETYFKSQRLLVDFLSNLQNVDWSVFSPGEQSSQPCPWFQSPVEEHHVKLIIVKYTKNHETWSKFWDLFKIVNSGQNCEIRSKWNRLINIFKFCNVAAELSTWQFDLGPISLVFPVKNLKKIRKKWELWKRFSHHDRQRCLTWKQGR